MLRWIQRNHFAGRRMANLRRTRRNLLPICMHPHETLKGIYQEHGCSVPRMVETLMDLDVPFEDVDLLSRMPWLFPANRIATERERLGLSAIHPLLHWKLPPPPPAWLTPVVIVKMFELALSDEYKEDAAAEPMSGSALILPA